MSMAADPTVVGGKAANLARLAAAGASVPAWIVLPAAAHAPGGEPSDTLMAEVAARLADAGLDDAVLAVRSSAVGEDAAGASFAGQFETVLGVAASDPAALRHAIATVWSSASAERVLAYRGGAGGAGGVGGDPPRMAVILQELVDAEAAGVAFSADPVTGDRGVAVVSAVHGLGEALVSGEEDGDSFRVRIAGEDASLIEVRAASQERALRREGAATRWVELGPAERDTPAITEGEAVEIARAARRIAASLGAPQDVEWALVPGDRPELAAVPGPMPPPPRRLVILQARPITTLPDGERRIWDNSNIVESYAGVTTPLTFSFARGVYEDVYRQFCGVMGVSDALIERNRDVFAHMLGLIRGRVYYNLLSWYRLLSLLPGYAFNRAFMERMMGVREKLTDPPEPQLVAGRWTDLGRLVRMVVRMVRSSRALRHDVPAFHRRLDDALLPLADVDFGTWASDDLLALYRRLEDDLLRHWQPPLVNDFFAMIWFGVLGRLVERWLPDEPPTLVNDLLAGEGGMISTEPARQVMALAGRVAGSPELEEMFRRYPGDGEVLEVLGGRLGGDASGGAGGETAGWGWGWGSGSGSGMGSGMGMGSGSGMGMGMGSGMGSGSGSGLGSGRGGGGGEVAAFGGELKGYLRRFGDRCANELKLETVTLSEDPVFLVTTIRSYWRQGATDPDASREREAGIRAAAEERVAARLGGVRRRMFGFVLGQARARIRDRENLRFERTRVFGVVRRIFLGFGAAMVRAGRMDRPRDVFWLTTGEVFGWADGTGVSLDLRPLIEARRGEFERYEAGPAPPERFETWGPPAEADFTRMTTGPSESDGAGGDGAGGGLSGIGCCPGVVRAPVRLVRDPREAGDLGGRILVAERTDPGWTLLFPSAAGILVQRGSLLSHSAIVAREMGIPCVVSVPGLMDRLEDGEVVEMDGTTGVIRRIDFDPGPGDS